MKLKKYLFIMILLSIIFLIAMSNVKQTIAINSNNIIVSGKVIDENNQILQNVKVKLIDNTSTEIVSTNTDMSGEWFAKVPEGKYKVLFEYPDNNNTKYTTNNISMKQYELYDKNLELAFVYGEPQQDKIKLFNDIKITEDGCILRLIHNKYSDDSDIVNKIIDLQNNSMSESENAFHNLVWEGNKGVTVILSDKDETEIWKYIEDACLGSDYNIIVSNTSESIFNIINNIYTKLGLTASENLNIIDNSNLSEDFASTIELDIESTSIVNVKCKKEITTGGGTGGTIAEETVPNGDFISGKIYRDGIKHQKEVQVKLINVNTNTNATVKESIITNNGEYSFEYPGAGKYKLEFDFTNTEIVNGQYYESDETKYSAVQEGGSSENCLYTTNLEDINDKFNQEIDYEIESQLDKNLYSDIGLKGWSENFYVPEESLTWSSNNEENKIIADVRLKQREKFSLTVKQDVHKYKIVLSNGQVFKQYNFDENSEYHKLRLFNITLEDNLRYGAKLYVEYKITVTNSSNIDCTGYTLLSRFENLEYDGNQYLLTDIKKKNNDQNWENIQNIDNVNNLIGTYDTTESTIYLKLKDSEGVAAGQEPEEHFVTLTKSLDAGDGCTFSGTSELIMYKNDKCRRNYSDISFLNDVTKNVIKAGNYISSGKQEEADIGLSETIAILPPTGFEIKNIGLIIFAIICFIIFRYIISKKIYISKRRRSLNEKKK